MQSREPLQLVNGTDGRALLEANKASRVTGLVNAAQRGHALGIYDGSFTCELVKCPGEQDTARARNARTRQSVTSGRVRFVLCEPCGLLT